MSTPRLLHKTRIAPTPSGYLHLGNVLSFSITAAIARQTNTRIFLRIDDLDRDRVEQAYVQDIFDTLTYMEIPWDDGPKNFDEYRNEYSQFHRMALYREALEQLKNTDLLFACTCSRTQIARAQTTDAYPGTCRDKLIPLDTPNASWRIRMATAERARQVDRRRAIGDRLRWRQCTEYGDRQGLHGDTGDGKNLLIGGGDVACADERPRRRRGT